MSEHRVGRRAEQKRRWDEAARHPCSTPDCPTLVAYNRTRCMDCRVAAEHEQRDARRREIKQRWDLGETVREIATALLITVGATNRAIHDMRRDGWDVSFRHKYPKPGIEREPEP
jgi:hypothetical protein